MVKDYDLTDVVLCKLWVEQKPSNDDGNVCNCTCCRYYANERDQIKRALARIESRLKRIEHRSSDRSDDIFDGRDILSRREIP